MRLGIYCRVSTEGQREGSSLDIQKENGIGFCKRMGYEYDVFSEVISGGNINREELIKLTKKIINKQLDGLWVYKWDRLIRSSEVGLLIKKLVIDTNCKIYVGSEEKNILEGSGILDIGMNTVFSEYEREMIRMRMAEGKIKRLKDGDDFMGVVSFGYRKVNNIKNGNSIVRDEKESKIIIECYKKFLLKRVKNYRDLVNEMKKKYNDDLDVRINDKSLSRILRDKKYKGQKTTNYLNKEYKINSDIIVDEELFDLVNNKVEELKGKRVYNSKGDYLLSDLIYCGYCGEKMYIVGNSNKETYKYFTCSSHLKNKKKNWDSRFESDLICDSSNFRNNKINVLDIEKIIWELLFQILNNSEEIKEEFKKKYDGDNKIKEDFTGKIKYYNKEIEKVEGKKDKVFEDYYDNEIDLIRRNRLIKKLDENIEKFKLKVNGLSEEAIKFNNKEVIEHYIDLMKSKLNIDYNNNRFVDRKRIIGKYIQSISIKCINIIGNNLKEYDIKLKLKLGDEDYNFDKINLSNNDEKVLNRNKINFSILNNRDMEIWRL